MATNDALDPLEILSIDDLAPELLVKIVECLDLRDLEKTSLVCKSFNLAVRDAAILLKPHWSVTNEQLQAICASFPKASSLDLSKSKCLSGNCLDHLQSLSQSLTSLNLSSCKWVCAAVLSHLPAFTNLVVLDLSGCANLTRLPESLGDFSSLQRLHLKVDFLQLSGPLLTRSENVTTTSK